MLKLLPCKQLKHEGLSRPIRDECVWKMAEHGTWQEIKKEVDCASYFDCLQGTSAKMGGETKVQWGKLRQP